VAMFGGVVTRGTETLAAEHGHTVSATHRTTTGAGQSQTVTRT
jgi:hypothetical protein